MLQVSATGERYRRVLRVSVTGKCHRYHGEHRGLTVSIYADDITAFLPPGPIDNPK